ncbi:MAG: hypothetical protein ACOYBU_18675, partial [Dermatophilaceae bacterium]
WPARACVLAGVLVALAALFGLGRLVGQRLHQSAVDTPAVTLAATNPPASPATSAAPQPPPAEPSPAEQIRADPAGVLAALAGARAAALTGADATALRQADAPESPMYRSDTALLATLAASGCSYAELSFQVRRAEWVSGDDATALLRAVVDRSAYRVVGPGRSDAVGAQPGTSYTYELAVVDAAWRIVTIT